MPVMDGFAATMKIRELEQSIPGKKRSCIVALTAGALRHEMERCATAGMDHFLSKPVRPKDLEAVLCAEVRRQAGRDRCRDLAGVGVVLGPKCGIDSC